MPSRSTLLALLVVGLLLLPGPMYAVAIDRLDGPERHRVPSGYVATPINASNDSALAERYANHLAYRPRTLSASYNADDYRAPNRTRRLLERAVQDGSATTDDDATRSDLARLERNYSLLTLDYDEYYAFSVAASDGTATVRANRSTDAEIAGVVRDELVVAFRDLSPAERRTVRKIRNATESEETYDYRPWSDEPVPDRPIVRKNGTHYAISSATVTDDFGPSTGVLFGFLGSLVGVACLVGAGLVALYARVRNREPPE